MEPGPSGHSRHTQGAQVNRERLDLLADRMQLLRRSNEILPPAKAGGHGVARLESLGARLDDLTDCAALQGLAYLKGRHIRFAAVHATAHVWVHRHIAIADQHLAVLRWRQFYPRQGKVSCGWNPIRVSGSSPPP